MNELLKELGDKFVEMQNLFLEMSILISKIEMENDKEKHA